jgi:predicted DNA-binding antitoxin AbrB/MazE fold protein
LKGIDLMSGKEITITKEGYEKLLAELDRYKTVIRKEVAEKNVPNIKYYTAIVIFNQLVKVIFSTFFRAKKYPPDNKMRPSC